MPRLPHLRAALAVTAGLLALCLAAPAQNKAPASLTAEQILDKSVEAAGGRAVLENVDSLVEKATLSGDIEAMDPFHFPSAFYEDKIPESHGTYESFWRTPDQHAVFVTEEGALSMAMGFDGSQGWSCLPRFGCRDWKAGAFPSQQEWGRGFLMQLDWRQLYSKVELLGTKQVSGRKTYVVRLTPRRGTAATRYYDAENFLLLRWEIFFSNGADSRLWTADLSNYYQAGGIEFPMVITYHDFEVKGDNNHVVVVRITYLAINAKIDDKVFAKPTLTKKP